MVNHPLWGAKSTHQWVLYTKKIPRLSWWHDSKGFVIRWVIKIPWNLVCSESWPSGLLKTCPPPSISFEFRATGKWNIFLCRCVGKGGHQDRSWHVRPPSYYITLLNTMFKIRSTGQWLKLHSHGCKQVLRAIALLLNPVWWFNLADWLKNLR